MIIDNYNTVDELANLLSIYGVDTSNWTHLQGNKTLEQLFIEIKEEEESSLEIS